ncbi:MAG: hypothetical protein MZV70_15225 [Desulfobacterales bacterium]|nr:hypothetical protein [Desulfobacterales bacterium]
MSLRAGPPNAQTAENRLHQRPPKSPPNYPPIPPIDFEIFRCTSRSRHEEAPAFQRIPSSSNERSVRLRARAAARSYVLLRLTW